MKKIYLLMAMVTSLLYSSQVGKVGINTSTPAATLDIQPNTANALTTATTAEGLLVPRVSRQRAANMGTTPAVSTLIYVNSVADGSAAGTTANVDAVGFYYFNGSVWTKLNAGGGGGTDTSIYAGDGTLTSARTVNQNNQNLTFTTGTGQMIVNGTTNLGGAVVVSSIRIDANATITFGPTDYMIHATNAGNVTINLPASPVLGRTVCVFLEQPSATTTMVPIPLGGYNYVAGTVSNCFMWNGANWIPTVGG